MFIGRTDAEAEAAMLRPPDTRQDKGTTEDGMIGWHHRLNGHEFE